MSRRYIDKEYDTEGLVEHGDRVTRLKIQMYVKSD